MKTHGGKKYRCSAFSTRKQAEDALSTLVYDYHMKKLGVEAPPPPVTWLGSKKMLVELIAAGGDTDTVASIAGQVAGTLIGRSSIDEALATRLPDSEMVERVSVSFANAVLSR